MTSTGNVLYRFTNAGDDTAMAIDPNAPRGGIVYQQSRPSNENSAEAYAQRWLLVPMRDGTYAIVPALHPDLSLTTENKGLVNAACFRDMPIGDGDLPGYLNGVTFNTQGGQKDPQCALGAGPQTRKM